MVTEESLNTASVTNRSESLAGFATNADFGLGADGVGGDGDHRTSGGPVSFDVLPYGRPSCDCMGDADSAPVADGMKGGPQLS